MMRSTPKTALPRLPLLSKRNNRNEEKAEAAMQRIIAAAVTLNGLTISKPQPARHYQILAAMPAAMARRIRPSDQGFLTDDGEFVGRETALQIASDAKQLLKPTTHRELFSEDLW